mmetsp:Transcript_88452/g.245625  ORF Transcript_88452/g.245625 Transcript_88452/m.245625 type:complete len:217 (-) Transcript_88452:2142-2792(-)
MSAVTRRRSLAPAAAAGANGTSVATRPPLPRPRAPVAGASGTSEVQALATTRRAGFPLASSAWPRPTEGWWTRRGVLSLHASTSVSLYLLVLGSSSRSSWEPNSRDQYHHLAAPTPPPRSTLATWRPARRRITSGTSWTSSSWMLTLFTCPWTGTRALRRATPLWTCVWTRHRTLKFWPTSLSTGCRAPRWRVRPSRSSSAGARHRVARVLGAWAA